jgi:hypothetical protein
LEVETSGNVRSLLSLLSATILRSGTQRPRLLRRFAQVRLRFRAAMITCTDSRFEFQP